MVSKKSGAIKCEDCNQSLTLEDLTSYYDRKSDRWYSLKGHEL